MRLLYCSAISNTGCTKDDYYFFTLSNLQATGRKGGGAGGETEMGREGAAEDHEECKG